MNRWRIGVLAAVLIVAAGCAPKADAPEDVAAIKALAATYAQAVTSGDVTALVSDHYADTAVLLAPNGPILVGKEAIRSSLRTFLDMYSTEEVDAVEDVRVIGDFAYARGIYTAKATPKVPGAAVLDDKGKWVSVYRRQPGGSWQLVVDIYNSDLPVVQVLAPGSADEQALLQLERDWTAAWLKQDAMAMDGILADGYVENGQGQITTKAQMIADLKAGVYRVESAETSDMRVVVFGDHAVVNGIGTSKYTMRGKDASEKNRWTDVYEKRDGRWRAVVSYVVNVE